MKKHRGSFCSLNHFFLASTFVFSCHSSTPWLTVLFLHIETAIHFPIRRIFFRFFLFNLKELTWWLLRFRLFLTYDLLLFRFVTKIRIFIVWFMRTVVIFLYFCHLFLYYFNCRTISFTRILSVTIFIVSIYLFLWMRNS